MIYKTSSFLDELDERAYRGNDLGSVYTPWKTVFKVWAPTAEDVVLKLYDTGEQGKGQLLEQAGMEFLEEEGIWTLEKEGDLAGVFYTYGITVNGQHSEVVDLYAKAVGISGNRAMVVNLENTNPKGFEHDCHVMQKKNTDAIIWEVHVKDFSSNPNSGISEKNRGKYLAFTEKNTTLNGEGKIATGVDYLSELGINYVHLLPVSDWENDELKECRNGSFNWGYDPKNYNVPEGVYCSDPKDGECRIREFKQMVMGLHQAGIGVVMDVVYNHTAKAEESWFHLTVPGYYYRHDKEGAFLDGSACGNETASEREMFRKFIVDSILYWATEYHVDGFRFDLMGLHDVDTMNAVRAALNEAGLSDVILYGEPWDAGSNGMSGEVIPANKNYVKNLAEGIAVFNDDFRDSVKGYVFHDGGRGFVQGGNVENPSEIGFVSKKYSDEDVIAAIQANAALETSKNSTWAKVPWAKNPSQSVQYISAHDNLTLWDKLALSTIKTPLAEHYLNGTEEMLQMNKLAAATLLTSQGMVFFQAGEEFARTKMGDENSYISSISINQLEWSNLVKFKELNDYYKGLIKLRKTFTPFRENTNRTNDHMYFLEDDSQNFIAYTISIPATKDEKAFMAAVLLNSTSEEKSVTLETINKAMPEEWAVVVDANKAGIEPLQIIRGAHITVPGRSALVLIDKERII